MVNLSLIISTYHYSFLLLNLHIARSYEISKENISENKII